MRENIQVGVDKRKKGRRMNINLYTVLIKKDESALMYRNTYPGAQGFTYKQLFLYF